MDLELRPLLEEGESSLAEAVYESILEAILAGRLVPGTILSEVALAKQLQVSRTPVHDALRQLGKDGVIEQSTGRRARVASFTHDDIFEIFELRKYLEGPAAELAAGRMDQRQLAPLRALANDLAADTTRIDWTARWADFDEEFHRVIADSSGNRRLAQDINRYRLLHRGFNRMSTDVASLQQALSEHFEILDALDNRQGARAREAMVHHIAVWQQFFIDHFNR
jgi:DNA-binding GntR family transcriptional regulator